MGDARLNTFDAVALNQPMGVFPSVGATVDIWCLQNCVGFCSDNLAETRVVHTN